MSAYNFQKEFAKPIERGDKRCTIRARRKTGYVPVKGEMVKLYTGMRTNSCRLLAEVKIKKVTPISIDTTDWGIVRVVLEFQQLSPHSVSRLAHRDGFKDSRAFSDFFNRMHGASFTGYLIEW